MSSLELARVELYALLPENDIDFPSFIGGYQKVRPLPNCDDPCWSLYCLDAAVMLGIVFTCEAPDPDRASLMVDRASRYAQSLRSQAGST